MDLPKKIKGIGEELEVLEDRIVITPKGALGFFAKGFKGSKEIPYTSITAVQLKKAGDFLSGYLQLTIPGGKESKGGVFAAASDENSFMFGKDQNKVMEEIKEFIHFKIANKGSHGSHKSSLSDELTKLNKLKQEGVISDEEFSELKKNLIKKSA